MGADQVTHPVRCWLLPGHEQCAVQAAADLTENRVAWIRGFEAAERLNRKPKRGRPRVLTGDQIREIQDLYGVNGGVVGLVSMRQLAAYCQVSYATVFNAIHAVEEAA